MRQLLTAAMCLIESGCRCIRLGLTGLSGGELACPSRPWVHSLTKTRRIPFLTVALTTARWFEKSSKRCFPAAASSVVCFRACPSRAKGGAELSSAVGSTLWLGATLPTTARNPTVVYSIKNPTRHINTRPSTNMYNIPVIYSSARCACLHARHHS